MTHSQESEQSIHTTPFLSMKRVADFPEFYTEKNIFGDQ